MEKHLQETQTTAVTKRRHLDTADIESIDLCDDDEDFAPVCATQNTKRMRMAESINDKISAMTTPLSHTGSDCDTEVISPRIPTEGTSPTVHSPADVTASPSTYGLPTPDTTPQKNKGLYAVPELADRYVPKTSTAEGVVYKDPKNFSLKPTFWKKWEDSDYAKFAEHLRLQFDPIPFARESGLSVEEIKHVFSALVCNPLYFAVEAKKRGEEGIKQIMEAYNEFGTPMRPWGKGEKGAKKVTGELHNVQAGAIELILENGSKGEMKLSDMSDTDIKYLKDTLMPLDKQKLWETSEEMAAYGPDGILL